MVTQTRNVVAYLRTVEYRNPLQWNGSRGDGLTHTGKRWPATMLFASTADGADQLHTRRAWRAAHHPTGLPVHFAPVRHLVSALAR
jgi:hypothetical protein